MSMLDQPARAVTGSVADENVPPRGSVRGPPRRLLQVVSGLAYGGIESWLLNVMRATDRGRYPMDFVVFANEQSGSEDEVRALGGRVILCPHARRPWLVARRFKEILGTEGPYDVVHSHVHHYSGLVLRLAAQAGVPVRVAHSHYDTRALAANRQWPRRLYLALMRHWIRRYATDRIAVSREAAQDLYGARWSAEKKCQILYCGLDFAPFAVIGDRRTLLAKLGLPVDALIIGHVGRFFEAKNHAFLLEIAAETFVREPRARFLCLGDGPLLREIQGRARTMGIADRVLFTGSRTDVPLLMTTVMGALVLPSHHEGLGLVLVEGQAAGLPCLMAAHLPAAAVVLPQLIHRLSLEAPAAAWAERLLQIAGGAPMPREQALAGLRTSDFSIQRSIPRLLQVYDGSPTG
jgi:glycosyltransferase involved in cell wall biosynthesis